MESSSSSIEILVLDEDEGNASPVSPSADDHSTARLSSSVKRPNKPLPPRPGFQSRDSSASSAGLSSPKDSPRDSPRSTSSHTSSPREDVLNTSFGSPTTRMSGIGWRQSSTMRRSPSVSSDRGGVGANEVLIGARRAKETKMLEEEIILLKNEVSELKATVKKLQAKDEKSKRDKQKFASRFSALLSAANEEAHKRAEEQSQEVLRAHQMTFAIMTQFKDYARHAEAKMLVMEQQMNSFQSEAEFLKARARQTEELAKAVVVFVRTEGLEEQQARLMACIKEAREANVVPAKPEMKMCEMSEDKRKAEAEDATKNVEDEAVIAMKARYASLVDRCREFEYFLDLKKKQQKEVLEKSAKSAKVQLSPAVESSEDGLKHDSDAPKKLKPKLMQMMEGDNSRMGGAKGLCRDRKMIQDFAFYDYKCVQHVQKKMNKLNTRNNRRFSKKVSQQPDALCQEANKREGSDLEWIASEITSKKSKYKIDPDWRTDGGSSLLHVVCEYEKAGKAVEHLIVKDNFDPRVCDALGLSAMHIACISGSASAVSAMLKHSPNNNIENMLCMDMSPLQIASAFGHVNICKLLLEAGSNTSADRFGATPLTYAVLNDQKAAAKYLAGKVFGLVNETDLENNSPLLLACCVSQHDGISDLLSAGANLNIGNFLGITPLWIAIQGAQIELVRLFLSHKPSDPSLKIQLDQMLGPFGNTLLMQIVSFLSDSDAAMYTALLIKHGVNVNQTNKERKTALFFAVAFDKREVVKVLLESGADTNWKDSNLNRPIHFAQSVDTITLLVAAGSKINVKNRQGNTPLHLAFAFQNRVVANVLLASGASEEIVNEEGQTCSDAAKYFASKFCFPFFEGEKSCPETGGIVLEE